MKKSTVLTIALVAISLAVVAVAYDPSSVMVFDGESVRYISYMQTVPESALGWCAPVAGLVNYGIFALAVVYALSKKRWCLKGILGLAVGCCCLVSLPIVVQGTVKIVPSVLGILLFGAQALVAYVTMKDPKLFQEQKQVKGKRLSQR